MTVPALIPLWTWSFISTTLGYFIMHTDPPSAYLLMVWTLAWMCLGTFVASSLNTYIRVVALVSLGAFLMLPVAAADWPVLAIFAAVAAFQIVMGIWGCRSIPYGRLPIIAMFSFGFVLGIGISIGFRHMILHFVSVVAMSIAGSLVGYALVKSSTPQQTA
ncbi:hypothetical protein C5Y93_00390 [Blastopirellula marina]|uniref:DUF1097 domain-containing protein n=1 Tax=Blastopirellula marina TaxID=124 RepID=A0A2S8GUR1_9BACT|nr:hypothetical protein C5Y93_00390 [Blastopirellula marina]